MKEAAFRVGLLMDIAMMSTTMKPASLMEEIAVGVTLTHNTAQSVDALTQMEAGVEQLAHQLLQLHQLLPSQVCQQLMTQVVMNQHCWCFDWRWGQISKSDKTENLKRVLF